MQGRASVKGEAPPEGVFKRCPPVIESFTATVEGTSPRLKVIATAQSAKGRIASFELTIDGRELKPRRVIAKPRQDEQTGVYRAVVDLPAAKKTTLQAVAVDDLELMSLPAELTIGPYVAAP